MRANNCPALAHGKPRPPVDGNDGSFVKEAELQGPVGHEVLDAMHRGAGSEDDVVARGYAGFAVSSGGDHGYVAIGVHDVVRQHDRGVSGIVELDENHLVHWDEVSFGGHKEAGQTGPELEGSRQPPTTGRCSERGGNVTHDPQRRTPRLISVSPVTFLQNSRDC